MLYFYTFQFSTSVFTFLHFYILHFFTFQLNCFTHLHCHKLHFYILTFNILSFKRFYTFKSYSVLFLLYPFNFLHFHFNFYVKKCKSLKVLRRKVKCKVVKIRQSELLKLQPNSFFETFTILHIYTPAFYYFNYYIFTFLNFYSFKF